MADKKFSVANLLIAELLRRREELYGKRKSVENSSSSSDESAKSSNSSSESSSESTKELDIKVGSYVRFNEHAYFYRHKYVFGKVKEIDRKTGKITLIRIKPIVIKSEKEQLYEYKKTKLDLVNVDKYDTITIMPKRGERAGPGKYRYNKHDIDVDVIDPEGEFEEEDVWN